MQGDNSWWSQMCLVASNYQRTWTDLTLPYAHSGMRSHGSIRLSPAALHVRVYSERSR